MPQVVGALILGESALGIGATMAVSTRAVNAAVASESADGFEIRDEYSRLAKLSPQLEHAAAPVPAAIGWGRQDPFGELERAIEAGSYRLRSGVKDPAGLAGPIVCHGTSLGKVLPSGSYVWFDPSAPAEDGDLVVFRYDDAWLREAIATNLAGDEDFRRAYGGWTSNVGIKLLGHHRARHLLYGDETVPMRLADGHVVLGVVRHVRDAHFVELYV